MNNLAPCGDAGNILVVDDSPDSLDDLRSALEATPYQIVEAISGVHAQKILCSQDNFSLILIAAHMQGLSGFETVSLIKSRNQNADIPVIFLTAAYKKIDHILQGYAIGAVDYLIKPCHPDILRYKIATFLNLYQTKKQLSISIEKQSETEHQLSLSRQLFEHASDGLILTDTDAVIQSANPVFEKITGYTASELHGKTPAMFQSGHHPPEFFQAMWKELKVTDVWEGKIRNRKKDGTLYGQWLKISGIKNSRNEVTHYLGRFRDLVMQSDKKNLEYLAHYDLLTGLPNRAMFLEVLDRELANAKRRDSIMAVFFIDLDHFKEANDTLGHSAGDALLKEVSVRLRHCIRKNDLISRQGGDEFTGILVDLKHAEDAVIVARHMLKELSEPVVLEQGVAHISGSIGISLYPDDADNADMLTRNADTAMYQAKEKGRNTYQFYTEAMHHDAVRRIELEAGIDRAIKEHEFELYYQPKIDTRTNQVTGMEALIRWNSPDSGMISPVEFIPLAEQTGQIVPIGEWVLRTACAQTKAWLDMGFPPLLVSVNVSSCQFRESGFMRALNSTLWDTRLPAGQLQLELTEGIIMQDDDATVARLQTIHNTGIHLSIDDFGTGYSSMSYLKRFPLYELKIDKSFINDICSDEDSAVIADAIIQLGRNLNLEVIAEGVEEEDQLNWLTAHHCHVIQGYYFSRPLPASEFEAFLTKKGK